MEFGYEAVTLSDFFQPCDLLAPTTRLWLAELLDRPGVATALFGHELASRSLPGAPAERAALIARLGAGLAPDIGMRLADHVLREVVPMTALLSGRVRCEKRLSRALLRLGRHDWPAVSSLRIGDLSRGRTGTDLALSLIGAALAAVARCELAAVDDRSHDCARQDGPAATPSLLDHAVLDEADLILRAVGSVRDRAVFDHLQLGLGPSTTGVEVARVLGISGEYVRRLRWRADERARAAFDLAPSCVADIVGELSNRLGTLSDDTATDDTLRALGLPDRQDTRSALLLLLAGPYRPVPGHDGWRAIDPAALIADTECALSTDGGVRDLALVRKEFAAMGVSGRQADAWLARQRVRVVVDTTVWLGGSVASVAERVLFAEGQPLTVAEVAERISTELGAHSARAEFIASVARALENDARFTAIGDGRVQLADWPAAAEPRRPLGEASVRDLKRQHLAHVALRIGVDSALLSGAPGTVQPGLVTSLGIVPGATKTFATRYGPVALGYPAGGPRHGSLRPVALAAGATCGDTLILRFCTDHTATVVVEPSLPASS